MFGLALRANDLTPRVGTVEIYGERKVSAQKIQKAIGAKPGDFLPSREDAEERIDRIPGVVGSRVEAACCNQNQTVLYVGIAERDTPHVEYHPVPTGDVQLPEDLWARYKTFLDEVAGSIRGHNADEDLTNGYSLMADPECRRIQESFIPDVAKNLAQVDRVLRDSADPEQRAAAAYLFQYGPRGERASKTVVDGLQYALRDTDDTVRQNALQSLKAVAVGGKLHPEQQVRIEPTWFVELLNSVVWSDRRGASLALVNMTDDRNAETLALIRERALPSVIEMARWHDLQHALPPFILAGRLAGLSEAQIKNAWMGDNREEVLKRAANPNGRHSVFSSVMRKSDGAGAKAQ
jgi:hypothetical protein